MYPILASSFIISESPGILGKDIGMSFFLGSGTSFGVFKIWQLFKTPQPDLAIYLAYNWRDEMAF